MFSILSLVTVQLPQSAELKLHSIRQQEDRYSWDPQVEANIKPSSTSKRMYKL